MENLKEEVLNNGDESPISSQHELSDHEDQGAEEPLNKMLNSSVPNTNEMLLKLRLYQDYKKQFPNTNGNTTNMINHNFNMPFSESPFSSPFFPFTTTASQNHTSALNASSSTCSTTSKLGNSQHNRISQRRSNESCSGSERDSTSSSPPNAMSWSYEEQFKQVRQLYDIDDNPKRKEFLDELFLFMQKKQTPINRLPIMAKSVLDLYQLYNLVVQRGGLVEVINKKLWQEIIKGLHLPSSITSAAFTLRTHTHAELDVAIDGNKRESRKNSYAPYNDLMSHQARRSPGMLVFPNQNQLNNPHLNTSSESNNVLSNRNLHLVTGGTHINTSLQNHNSSSQTTDGESRLLEYMRLLAKEANGSAASSVAATAAAVASSAMLAQQVLNIPQAQNLISQTAHEDIRKFALWNFYNNQQFLGLASNPFATVNSSTISSNQAAVVTEPAVSNIKTEETSSACGNNEPLNLSDHQNSLLTKNGVEGSGFHNFENNAQNDAGVSSKNTTSRATSPSDPVTEDLNLTTNSIQKDSDSPNENNNLKLNSIQSLKRKRSHDDTNNNVEKMCFPFNASFYRQDSRQINVSIEVEGVKYKGVLTPETS